MSGSSARPKTSWILLGVTVAIVLLLLAPALRPTTIFHQPASSPAEERPSTQLVPFQGSHAILQRVWVNPDITQLHVFVLGRGDDARGIRLSLRHDEAGVPGARGTGPTAPLEVVAASEGFRVVFPVDERILQDAEVWLWAAFSRETSQGSVHFLREISSHTYPGGQLMLSTGQRNVSLPGVLSFSLRERQWQWTRERPKLLALLVLLLAWSPGLPRKSGLIPAAFEPRGG